ncbi:MAG: TspO/MBR family protein [Sphingomonas sp.]
MAETARLSSWWKVGVLAVVAIELLGGLSGWVSNSGYSNAWFDSLQKPVFMPPGWTFGVVWPILYAFLGISLAIILAEPQTHRRRLGLIFFAAQLFLNFAWSPIFFAAHDIALAKWVILVMAILAAAAALQFLRIRKVAGLLLMPYLAWLIFAASLNVTIERLNPGMGAPLLH